MSKQLNQHLIDEHGENIIVAESLIELEKLFKEIEKERKNEDNDLKKQIARCDIALEQLLLIYSNPEHHKLYKDKLFSIMRNDLQIRTGNYIK